MRIENEVEKEEMEKGVEKRKIEDMEEYIDRIKRFVLR